MSERRERELFLNGTEAIRRCRRLVVNPTLANVYIHQDSRQKTVRLLGEGSRWQFGHIDDTVCAVQCPVPVSNPTPDPKLSGAEARLFFSERIVKWASNPNAIPGGADNSPVWFPCTGDNSYNRPKMDRLFISLPAARYLRELEITFAAGGELCIGNLNGRGWTVVLKSMTSALSVVAENVLRLESLSLDMPGGDVHIAKLTTKNLNINVQPAGVVTIAKGSAHLEAVYLGGETLLRLMGQLCDWRSHKGLHRLPPAYHPSWELLDDELKRMLSELVPGVLRFKAN